MNLPGEFSERMRAMLGSESDAFFESFRRERYGGLRVNLLKTSVDGFRRMHPFSFTPIPWCDSGFYYDPEAEQEKGLRPGKHPFHEAGLYYIQEPSAMAVAETVRLLIEKSEKPLRVLDLCAAPGGKSSQLASIMRGRGFLVSNEIHPARAKILSQNMERMGLTNGMVTNHAPAELSARFPRCFDVIVVDAPCSGEGMFRKDEDTIAQWSPENVKLCVRRQKEILTEAETMLAPGGTLVYSTCTFAPAENEAMVLWMLRRWPEWEAEPVSELFEDFRPGRPEWMTEELDCDAAVSNSAAWELTEEEKTQIRRTARLWPQHLDGEGHFVAKLHHRDDETEDLPETKRQRDALWFGGDKKKKKGAAGSNRPLSRPPKEWEAFAKAYFHDGEAALNRICGSGFQWLMFGEQLYAAHRDCPHLDGLTVLRPGLHLGTIKKGRLEPSHALAMALTPEIIEELHLEDRCLELCGVGTVNTGDAGAETAGVQDAVMGEDLKDLAGRYLRGETLALDAVAANTPAANAPVAPVKNDRNKNGWNIVTYCGFPLGWAKVSDGLVKNHYPKGLRWV